MHDLQFVSTCIIYKCVQMGIIGYRVLCVLMNDPIAGIHTHTHTHTHTHNTH